MELEKAIEILKEIRDVAKQNVTYIENNKLEVFLDINYKRNKEDFEAVNTVLSALDERYNKGYQDGFKQAKFDYEMDKLQKEMTVSELAKIIKNDIELGEYCTDCRFYDYCHPQVNEALCSTIEDIIKIAKEKKEVE